MFKKRITIFKQKDSETWKKIKAALKEEGFRGVRSGHYLQDVVMNGGCGAKLDPRNFGPKGKIDREIYWVEVLEEDVRRADDALKKHGILATVDEYVMQDASQRKRVSFID